MVQLFVLVLLFCLISYALEVKPVRLRKSGFLNVMLRTEGAVAFPVAMPLGLGRG